MTIQEFSVQLEQSQEGAPLLQALQALRTCPLEQLREISLAGWNPWMDSPRAVLDQPELRN